MADYRLLMPFVLHSETSTPIVEPVERMYELAASKGPSSHPLDKGGLTFCGVTLATFRQYCKDKGLSQMPQNLPFTLWADIFKSMFWDRWKADAIISDKVAAALVDWTWVSGANGIKLPQKLLGVKADGVVGPCTLQAVNAWKDPDSLFRLVQESRKAYHSRIAPPGSSNRVFLRGWNARVDRLTSFLKNRNV